MHGMQVKHEEQSDSKNESGGNDASYYKSKFKSKKMLHSTLFLTERLDLPC